MKKIWILLCSCSLLFACNNNKDSKTSNSSDATKTADDIKKGKKISTLDISVNKGNSFSDLFLDSTEVSGFLVGKNLDPTIERRIRSFYNARNFEFAWFAGDGLTEQALGFWNLYDYYNTYSGDTSLKDAALSKTMDELMLEDSMKVTAGNKSFIQTELNLTRRFIEYSLENFDKGTVKRKELERFIPIKKTDPLQLADSIISKKHKDDKYYDDINPLYKQLKTELAKYYTVVKNGGWPVVTTKLKSIKAGTDAPEIVSIKKLLSLTGDMAAGDTSSIFDSSLVNGVKNFQQRFGYKATGIITAEQIRDMNVPAVDRLKQLLVNMERMRWMPSRPEGSLVVVNIPEFILHMYEGPKKAFDMNVVVGKEGHNTVLFTGDLNQIVFSPYWNLPSSIVKKEVMGHMSRNPGYLARNHMEVVGKNGGTPVIRQLPGPWNSLGLVKFLFPNSYNIYFHDTNAKGLFAQDKRAYSHGCIRLSEPAKMAEYLLRNDAAWNPEKISDAMHSGKEKFVRLKDPVPVFISYYTAWVDEKGVLNFRDDIYGHDKNVKKKMFIAP